MVDILKALTIIILGVIAIAVITMLVFGVFSPLFILGCNQQTAQIGMNHKWTFFGGCMIEPEEGVWIPLANYRIAGIDK